MTNYEESAASAELNTRMANVGVSDHPNNDGKTNERGTDSNSTVDGALLPMNAHAIDDECSAEDLVCMIPTVTLTAESHRENHNPAPSETLTGVEKSPKGLPPASTPSKSLWKKSEPAIIPKRKPESEADIDWTNEENSVKKAFKILEHIKTYYPDLNQEFGEEWEKNFRTRSPTWSTFVGTGEPDPDIDESETEVEYEDSDEYDDDDYGDYDDFPDDAENDFTTTGYLPLVKAGSSVAKKANIAQPCGICEAQTAEVYGSNQSINEEAKTSVEMSHATVDHSESIADAPKLTLEQIDEMYATQELLVQLTSKIEN